MATHCIACQCPFCTSPHHRACLQIRDVCHQNFNFKLRSACWRGALILGVVLGASGSVLEALARSVTSTLQDRKAGARRPQPWLRPLAARLAPARLAARLAARADHGCAEALKAHLRLRRPALEGQGGQGPVGAAPLRKLSQPRAEHALPLPCQGSSSGPSSAEATAAETHTQTQAHAGCHIQAQLEHQRSARHGEGAAFPLMNDCSAPGGAGSLKIATDGSGKGPGEAAAARARSPSAVSLKQNNHPLHRHTSAVPQSDPCGCNRMMHETCAVH